MSDKITMTKEMLFKAMRLSEQESKKEENTDPRWDKLKQLLTDK
jgi:uncharacterized metal-binding protein YceD (DUF177 family)